MVLVWFCFPHHDEERGLLEQYAAEDGAPEQALAA
jgi:hypothetical protein